MSKTFVAWKVKSSRVLFTQDVFKGLEDEEDEDMEISQMVNEYKKKGGTIIGELFVSALQLDSISGFVSALSPSNNPFKPVIHYPTLLLQ